MLSAHTAPPRAAARPAPTRSHPALAAVAPPASSGPEAPDGDHSLLGVLPLPESGRYMLVYGVVVDEPHPGAPPAPETGADLLLDRDSRRVWSRGAEVELTFQEYELLECLTASPGRAVTRGELMERVWGTSRELHSRTIDVHIHRLRRKLGRAGGRIATVRKVGYIYHGPPTSVPERGD
ncbi:MULTISPECIES: winged helix-turn-helix domain-containing protein [unclassified Nocardiopsis]|uniref:winged helix-turn-helix domain-containing protein n=1 Tax=unclassified Nocardiopsis TaxID=2649073 RepID=UPI0033E3285C